MAIYFRPKATLALGLALALAAPLASQEDERGYLQAFLEDNLSADGMKLGITGLTGSLSSTAEIAELTLSDDQGVWLRLTGVSLDWNRVSLLSGAVDINELTADQIVLSRLPKTETALVVAEASAPFALPELPVSVQIGRIGADQLTLGPGILGQSVTASMEGSASIAGGQGQGSLRIDRLDDGPAGELSLDVGYTNQTGQLSISLDLTEEPGGIAASLIGLPGLPSTSLQIKGAGPLSDFRADLGLSTNGISRLAGEVILTERADPTGPIQGFSAKLSGNPAPLFLPEYAGFLGDSIALDVIGTLPAPGGLDLSELHLSARSLQLDGHLFLTPDGLPQAFALDGQIALPDGTPVLLPLPGKGQTRLTDARLNIGFDASQGDDGWTAAVTLRGLDHPDLQLSNLSLTGAGQIGRDGETAKADGALTFTAQGLTPVDATLARATGSVLWGETRFMWSEGSGVLRFRDLSLQGEDYLASGQVNLNTLTSDSLIDAEIDLSATDLSRFADLVGLPLGGAADARIKSSLHPLTGSADVVLTAKGRAIAVGNHPLDRLLSGESTVKASVLRDMSGIALRDLRIETASFLTTAKGQISSTLMDLTTDIQLDDLTDLGTGYAGAVSAQIGLTGTPSAPIIALSATGQDLTTGQAEADKLLSGSTAITARIAGQDGIWAIEDLTLTGPQLTAKGSGQTDGTTARMKIDATLRNLGLFLPEYPGALTLRGEIDQTADGYFLNLKGKGPGGIDLTAAGTIDGGFGQADLTIKGRANAALANPFLKPRSLSGDLGFDLAIRGPLDLSAASGPITLTNGHLADPGLPFNLTDLAASLRLDGGKAAVDARAAISTGGNMTVKGDLSLSAPFTSNLGIDIGQARLRDPALYDVPLTAKLSLNGPLLGSGGVLSGRIDIGRTELILPSTGLTGADLLPGLKHLAEPAAVKSTRQRAGLIEATASRKGSSNLGLDLLISAPSQVFLRGRGLDAELGGELRLSGTLSSINPQGGISLIRGRLDILGKRMVLSRADITMEGAMVPTLDIAADTETTFHTVTVGIEGPANDPNVSFTAAPDLPEEEVLAVLLFDQESQNLSPLQALQLAEAVAQLAGRGGEGTISRLRKSVGLDNLDVKTNTSGDATVTAGKYLTEKIYSEVAIEQNGKSQVNLNLDLNAAIKLRARTDSDGSSGIGIVFEKDY